TGQFRSVIRKLAGARGAGTAQSWLATANLDDVERELARSYIEGFFAAPAAFVGIEGVANDQGMRTRRVVGGYDRALRGHADALRAGGVLRLCLPVERVRWRNGHVPVQARTGRGAREAGQSARGRSPLGGADLRPHGRRDRVAGRRRPDGRLERGSFRSRCLRLRAGPLPPRFAPAARRAGGGNALFRRRGHEP